MTVITKLTMRGFKSFAKKTEIPMLPGFNCFLGPNGNGKCLLSRSNIFLMDRGLVKIGDFVEEEIKDSFNIKNLKDGIYVDSSGIKILSINQSTMKQEIKEVSKCIRRNGEPELYEIVTRTGKKLTATSCHPMIIYKNHIVKSCLISELKEGERIASPRIIKGEYSYHNPNMARLLGYIIGDGSISQGANHFVNMEEELLEDYKNILKTRFNQNKFYNHTKGKATQLYFRDKEIFEFFQDKFNTKIKVGIKKNIPAEFMFGDDETIGNLLAGLYDTDGHFHIQGKHIEFSNKNELLVDQIQMLLLRFGIISVKKEKMKYATNTKEKIKRKYFFIYIYGNENYKKFLNNIPIRVKHKKESLIKAIRNIKTNENIDLLPKEVNQTLKETAKILGLKIKCLKKKYPSLAAYTENRCCPSREGVNKIVGLFVDRWFELYNLYTNMGFEAKQLVESMDTANISSSICAQILGIRRENIRKYWVNEIFKPKTKNHLNYYHYLRSEIAFKLNCSKFLITQLNKLATSDIFWDEIVSINKVKGEKYVYDLTIEGTHNFVAEGLYAHNSNVVDAICFVLGKSSARELRAEKSAHLIYNGGKLGKPASDAEVEIEFDNSSKVFPIDSKSIKVKRVVKQSGNSTYFINDKVMTRQQVVDVLSAAKIDPDGHNIVLQGDIIRFMDMKPAERRVLIEDIAGISVFEEKKNKAMNELNRVQEKLNEAEIILTEREKTLKDLKKDRDQALQYKEMEGNIERNKATRASLMLKEKTDDLEEVEKKHNELEKEVLKMQEEINNIKQEILDKKKEIEAITNELTGKGDAKQKELGREIEDIKTKIIKDSSRKDVCDNELKKLKERKKSLEDSIKEYDKKCSDLKIKQEKLNKDNVDLKKKEEVLGDKIKSFKKKHGIVNNDEISKIIEDLDNKLETKQKEILEIEEQKQNELRKKDRLEYEISALDEKLNKLKELKKDDQDKVSRLKKDKEEYKEISKKLGDCLNESSVFSVQLSTARNKLMDANDEHTKLRTRNLSIREFTSGDLAIKKINELKWDGVHGTVAELGQVGHKYSMALEVAAGTRMKSIVVSSDAVAAKCIQYLKDNKLGVVTFLPLNKLQERTITDDEKKLAKEGGAHGMAINLVKYDSKFSNVFKYVLGGTIVVDDINTARKIGVGRARMVTLSGDLTDISGAMIGGHRRESGLGFQQKEVSDGLEKVEKEIEKLSKTVELLEKQKMENDENVIKYRERKAVLDAEIKALEISVGGSEDPKEIEAKKKELLSQVKDFDSNIKEIETKNKSFAKDFDKLKQEKQAQIEILSNMNSSGKSKELEDFETEKQNIREQVIKNNSETNSIDNEMNLYNSEKEKVSIILKNNDKDFEVFSKEFKELNEELGSNQDILKIKEKTQKQFYAEYAAMYTKRTKIEEVIKKKEENLIRNEERIRSAETRKNDITIRKALIGGEVEGLKKEFEPFKDVQLRRGITLPDLNAEIKSFENMLRDMGNVNLRALEIYDKVFEEYGGLQEKFSKLKLEKDDVLKLMFEIDSKKQETFMKTFKLLERNFKEIFSSLSEKGEAELVIEMPESVFDGGVDIRVKITGSKYLDIKSLSGGEKTLTALAFIFAIQEFEPSWFYVMDEVDAALDKRNSELLSKLIAKYSKGAQYVVISHNDAVISESDTIYGVTMQEGVSRVVSLKV